MGFSRTSIKAYITEVIGLLTLLGIGVPPEATEALVGAVDAGTDVINVVVGALIMVWGAIDLWFRNITDSPTVRGFLGFLGFK